MPALTKLEAQLALACVGQVAVTVLVWIRLFYIRIGEITSRKIKSSKLTSRAASAVRR